MLRHWLPFRSATAKVSSARTVRSKKQPRSFQPVLEELEPREVPSATVGAQLTGNAAFVEALYNDFLHRDGNTSPGGDAYYWVNALDNFTLTPGQVVNDILHSPESLTDQVDSLYEKILDRQADPGGRAYFVSLLQGGGTLEQVMSVMLSSAEYAGDTGGSDTAFIQSLYTKILNRTAAASEVQGWLNVLPEQGDAAVVNGFLNSAEFRGDAIAELYDGAFTTAKSIASILPDLLQRTASPSAGEIGGWVNSGLDLLTIEGSFASSAEFLSKNGGLSTYVPDEPSAGGTYSPVQGTLFGPNGPSYLDVAQGEEGDCWLLSGLAETAAREPSVITSMFTSAGTASVNGAVVQLYTVRLYDANGTAHTITVDNELPDGGNLYDQPVNGVLWVALAEKAYAEANGAGIVTTQDPGVDSYSALDGGDPAWALQAITGQPANDFNVNPSDIASAWNAGQLIVIATGNNPSSPYIVGDHAYAVVGYNPASSQPFQVFNPWGGSDSNEWVPGMDGQTYGLFWASGDFLTQNYQEETIAGAANLVHQVHFGLS